MPSYDPTAAVSGHVFLRRGKRRDVWYAKWRDAVGQHQKRLGPDWTGRGVPPPRHFREREAREALAEILVEARRGNVVQHRTGFTFRDAAEQWFTRGKVERDWSPNTRATYRSVLDKHLLPEFGDLRLESVTTQKIETWRNRKVESGEFSRRNANLNLAVLYGIFKRAIKHHNLRTNPAEDVPKLRESYDANRFDFYSPAEVNQLVAAAASTRDGVIFLVAAFTGLRRGELVALRWEDVDFKNQSIRVFEGYTRKTLKSPKSRKSRTVPMSEQVAHALTGLRTNADHQADARALVFPGELGDHLDASALRRRFLQAVHDAGLRRLRLHDLRHTFGSLSINTASIAQVQAWMGHADVKTTMRYLHHKSRASDADLLSAAFQATGES